MPLIDAASRDGEPTMVLTNDDGWDAPGLAALRQASDLLGRCCVVAPSGPDVWVRAPRDDRRAARGDSAARRLRRGGRNAGRLRAARRSITWFLGRRWVLAGINAGGNLGTDIHYSGTVAAVREAVIHGVPGIALSHYIARGRAVDWDRAGRWAEAVLARLMVQPWEPGTFWNVNFPHPEPDQPDPDIVFCPFDPSPLPLRYRVEGDQFGIRGRLPIARAPAGIRCRCLFRRRDRRDLIRIAGDRFDRPTPFARPSDDEIRRSRFRARLRIERPREKVWPTTGTGMP